jgi:hypothetical protein
MSITTNEIPSATITENTAVSGGEITGITADYLPLVHRLLINKFQLYNKSTQKLNGDVHNTFELRPFQLFEDSKQSDSSTGEKKFVLTGFTFRPISCRYEDVQLNEYDNSTPITLNIID